LPRTDDGRRLRGPRPGAGSAQDAANAQGAGTPRLPLRGAAEGRHRPGHVRRRLCVGAWLAL